MRAPIFALSALLLLSACGGQEAAQNASANGSGLASDTVYVNDSTAIDAASGADANMAADVDLNFGREDEDDGDSAGSDRPRRSGGTSTPSDRDDTEPAGPAGNNVTAAPEDDAGPETATD